MRNLPLCHWSTQLFDLRVPSSTDVPVLLLNQPVFDFELSNQIWNVKPTLFCIFRFMFYLVFLIAIDDDDDDDDDVDDDDDDDTFIKVSKL